VKVVIRHNEVLFRIRALLFLGLFALSACQSVPELKPTQQNLQPILKEVQDKSQKSGLNQYKYVSETALLLFYQGQHQQAESYFEKAFHLEDKAYTKSVTQLILSKIINENTKQFRAHYLERWHLRYMASLNYLAQAKSSEALVELRRLSQSCREEKDAFSEVRIESAKKAYLIQTGVLFCILGREEEGKADLRYMEDLKGQVPNWLASQAWFWKNKNAMDQQNNTMALEAPKEKRQLLLKIKLKGKGPQKVEQRLNVTMFGYLPLIQAYMEGQSQPSELNHVQDIATGVLGKRLIEIAYPILKSNNAVFEYHDRSLNLQFGQLYQDSWDAQKNHLIAQSILRVIAKVWASYQVEHAIEKSVEGPWGQLLGNLGRLALWKTEQADIRQIDYMPNQVSLEWMWEKGDAVPIQVKLFREDLF